MDDLEELESWHEDLMAWERFQDELERIKGGNTYDGVCDFGDIKAYPCSRKPTRNLSQNAATIRRSNSGNPPDMMWRCQLQQSAWDAAR